MAENWELDIDIGKHFGWSGKYKIFLIYF